jgi:hypothetical protein
MAKKKKQSKWREYVSSGQRDKDKEEFAKRQWRDFHRHMHEKHVNGEWGQSKAWFDETNSGEQIEVMIWIADIPGEKIPHGLLAPVGWDNYSSGEITGSHIRIHKDNQINTNVFETLNFEMVKDIDIWE